MKYLLLLISLSAWGEIILTPPSGRQAPLTKQQKQALFAHGIQSVVTKQFLQLSSIVGGESARFWDDSDGLSVQEHFSSFGKDQCAIRRLFLATGQLLNTAKPGSFAIDEPKVVTMSGDGDACVVSVAP